MVNGLLKLEAFLVRWSCIYARLVFLLTKYLTRISYLILNTFLTLPKRQILLSILQISRYILIFVPCKFFNGWIMHLMYYLNLPEKPIVNMFTSYIHIYSFNITTTMVMIHSMKTLQF